MPTETLEKLTVKMLQTRLKKEGRSTNGRKAQLVARLAATLRAKEKSIQKNSCRSSAGNVAALCGVSKATERQLLKDARYKPGSHTLCVPLLLPNTRSAPICHAPPRLARTALPKPRRTRRSTRLAPLRRYLPAAGTLGSAPGERGRWG